MPTAPPRETALAADLFDRRILSVSQLTGRLKDLIEAEFGNVWIWGEISNLRRPASGHVYLTLKDEAAQMRAVMFRVQTRYLDFEPADGQEVLVRGRLTVYEPRGDYQIILDYMEPRGEGALRLAFEKLKGRLAAEGLFDEARKKSLPFMPRRVALVTSPTGAAVRDFIRLARERFENAVLSVYPVRVQGQGAAEEIAGAIGDLNAWGGFDVIVLTRGGGSLEDLWAFNEEIVARAVAASRIPVVSAVGHEVDFSISDFVADARAATPSAAAALVFRDKQALLDHLRGLRARMAAGVHGRLQLARERLAHQKTRLGDPRRVFADRRLKLDDLSEELIDRTRRLLSEHGRALLSARARLAPAEPRARLRVNRSALESRRRELIGAGRLHLERARDRTAAMAGRLGDLSPLRVLERGYAIARQGPEKRTVRSSTQVAAGERLDLLLGEGELLVIVDEVLA